MAFVFDSTLSGPAANSYVSVSAADDYFAGNLEGVTFWSPLTTAKKQAALVQATYRLEQEQYGGDLSTSTQRLQWPRQRIYVRESDYQSIQGSGYRPNNVHPQELEFAVLEQALYYVKKFVNSEFTMQDENLETMDSYSVGPLDMTMRKNVKADRLPTKVKNFLKAIGPNGWLGEKAYSFKL